MSDHLDRAEKALAKRNATAALVAMLDAWRETRAPAYADAVDAVSNAAGRGTKVATHEAWMELALRNDAGDVGSLVDALLVGKISTLGSRVEHLCSRPDDPRIAMAFARAALEPPMTASSNFQIWTKMYAAMIQIGDSRISGPLQKRLAQKQGDSNFWPRHYKAIEKILTKLPEPPKVSADEKKRLKAIATSAKSAAPAGPAKKTAGSATPKGDPLERAATAAESGAWRDCLSALLDAWRPLRLAALGAAIDRVSAILEDGRPMPHGKKVQAAWLAMAEKNDVADVGLLAQSSSDPKAVDAESNMDRMATWPEDPRIGIAMLTKTIASTYSDRGRAWTLVGALLVRNADERFKESVEQLANDRSQNKARNGSIGRLTKELAPIFAKIDRELGPADHTLLARVNAAVDAYHAGETQTERTFLAEIAADHAGDEPRLVYADWLTERGHPRGELIVLQCAQRAGTATPAQLARIAELFEHSPRPLLGPLASLFLSMLGYALRRRDVFDRGLPSNIDISYSPPAFTLGDTPLLGLVEQVAISGRGQDEILHSIIPAAPKLRRVEGLTLDKLVRLARSPVPSSIQEVVVSTWGDEDLQPNTLAALDGAGLSNLKSFDFTWGRTNRPNLSAVYFDTWPDALLASRTLNNVEHIVSGATNLEPLLAGLKKHKRKVRRVTFAQHHFQLARVDVELDVNLSPTSIRIGTDDSDETSFTNDHGEIVYAVLEALQAPKLAEIRFDDGLDVARAVKTRIATIAKARFKGASLVD